MSLRAVALAVAGGLMQTASFAPLHAWPLQIAGLALLVAALADATPRRAAALGWLFAFAWLTSSLWWVYISMHRYGHLPAPLAALATALLGALLALYYAVAAAAWARWRAAGAAAAAIGFAALWLLAELARAVLFTGFPWAAGGYAQTVGPLAGWAPWIGVYGIGALAAWLAAALALAFAARHGPRRWPALLAPLALAAAGPVLPREFTRSAGTLDVTLLQPNVAQDEKFDPPHIERLLNWHVDALARSRGTLVVTPESSIPLPAQLIDDRTAAALRAPFEAGDRAALVGVFTGSEAEGYVNSLVALSATSGLQGAGYRYGKRHLLPFGEFIPPGFGWFVALMQIPIGDQARGTSDVPLAVAGQRVRPLICYEDLFGEDIAASIVGPRGATVLANATNLAWFGRWLVQDQHLQFSQMRALEFQRPVVRATNTGATAAIDHRGRVIARLPPEREGVLEVRVDGRIGDTPYARWLAAVGLWPLGAVSALALVASARRRPPAGPGGTRTHDTAQ